MKQLVVLGVDKVANIIASPIKGINP